MNKLFIIGNLTADPVSRTTQSGKQVCSFTIAVNRRGSQQEAADFFRISAWNGLADICQRYLAKGRKVAVTGSVSVSTYTTQNGETRANLEVSAEDVEFLTPRTEIQQAAPVSAPVQAEKKDQASEYVVVDDELPF